MTGRPGCRNNGNVWRKYRVVPRAYPSHPLICPYFHRVGNKERFRLPGGGRGSTSIVQWTLRPVIFGVDTSTLPTNFPNKSYNDAADGDYWGFRWMSRPLVVPALQRVCFVVGDVEVGKWGGLFDAVFCEVFPSLAWRRKSLPLLSLCLFRGFWGTSFSTFIGGDFVIFVASFAWRFKLIMFVSLAETNGRWQEGTTPKHVMTWRLMSQHCHCVTLCDIERVFMTLCSCVTVCHNLSVLTSYKTRNPQTMPPVRCRWKTKHQSSHRISVERVFLMEVLCAGRRRFYLIAFLPFKSSIKCHGMCRQGLRWLTCNRSRALQSHWALCRQQIFTLALLLLWLPQSLHAVTCTSFQDI